MIENVIDIVGKSWTSVLFPLFQQEWFLKMGAWISHTRESKTIYPESEDVFKAYKFCPFNRVKVVILGQDPYHNGVADGLCFSYKNGLQAKGMQSLDVIIEEIERDCYEGFNPTRDYQLNYLAREGVFLLNTVLTVFRGQPGSHRGLGWEKFTNATLLSLVRDQSPKVFMLWGNDAKNSMDVVLKFNKDQNRPTDYPHLFLYAPHPASDLYKMNSFREIKSDYPNTFTGCKHFSQANEFLKDAGYSKIDWLPVEDGKYNPLSDDLPF